MGDLELNGGSVCRDGNVVDIDGLLCLWGKPEEAGRTLLVGVAMIYLDGPGLGFGLPLDPGLGPDHSGAILRHIDARLQGIPLVCRNPEGNRFLEPLVIGTDLEEVGVSDQRDDIALVDQTDRRFNPPATVGRGQR